MEKNEILLTAVSDKLQYMGRALRNPHHFSIARGNCYAVIGENGCGKTTLGKIIEKGWNICTNVIHGDKKSLTINNIEFSDIHSFTGSNVAYYQQRFEATQNDEIPTVEEIIKDRIPTDRWNELCDRLSLRDIMHKRINFLSSGELRKFLIINLFSTTPDILIIDNPYIGLDAQSRELFNELINNITREGTAVILLLCNPIDIPSYCNYILPMKDMEIGEMKHTTDFSPQEFDNLFPQKGNVDEMPIAKDCGTVDFDTAIKLNNCNVCYGKNVILHNVSWEVKAGEKWALLGENGCGKSTLLSLVYADNPQGYHNDITLKQLARLIYINSKYLGRLFHQQTGVTFHAYLNELRLQHALNLLVETDRKMIEIAGQVGFETVTYFNRRFRQKYGCTPTEYRAKMREKGLHFPEKMVK